MNPLRIGETGSFFLEISDAGDSLAAMDAAGQEPGRQPYVLGLVILVHGALLLLFVMSSDPVRETHHGGARTATGGSGASLGPSAAAPGPRREGFLLSFDPVGLTGASSFPPPAKVAPHRHPS